MFNRNKTKWRPLGNYAFADADYIVFARADRKTGLMDFKVSRVQAWRFMSTNKILPNMLIDTKEAWDKLVKEIESGGSWKALF
jgi:hypothetical protein